MPVNLFKKTIRKVGQITPIAANNTFPVPVMRWKCGRRFVRGCYQPSPPASIEKNLLRHLSMVSFRVLLNLPNLKRAVK
jgi:hypothetical protein